MPGPFPAGERWGDAPFQATQPARASTSASLSLGAGLLSFFCVPGFGALLAIALGWIAHSEIERSDGRLSGKGLANAGIGLGITNLVASIVGVGVLFALALRPDPIAARPLPPAVVAPPIFTSPAPAAPVPAPGPGAGPGAAVAEADLPSLPPHIGKIPIFEAAVDHALESQLLAQLAASTSAGEQVVLWTVTPNCDPCAAVGRALADARMQRALSKVRLVRADAASFPAELQQLGVPIDTVPGFTLLDSHAHATDHIHGGEWDADIPANIAPILDRFVKHSFTARRHPWSRPLRDGETPL